MKSCWSDADSKRLLALLDKATSWEGLIDSAGKALDRPITKDVLGGKLRRLGMSERDASERMSHNAKRLLDAARKPNLPVDDVPEAHDEVAESVERLVKLAKKGRDFESVCDELDVSPRKLRELIDIAQAEGYRVELDDGHVGKRPSDSPLEEQLVSIVSPPGDTHKLAAVGDLHAGSKHCLVGPFQDFYYRAYEEGVRTFLQVGDLTDGVYRHSVWEQSARGFEEQVEAVADVVPELPGATVHFIEGNHDETFAEQAGINVGAAIVAKLASMGRKDFVCHGSRGAYIRLKAAGEERGLLVELWHPKKGGAYAKSYTLQKKIEKYAVGQKPDLLLVGHTHQQMYLTVRGVHAVSCGCWQGGGSSYGKSLGGAPDIGSWILEYAMTPEGTVRRMKTEWHAYYETEAVREVGLG